MPEPGLAHALGAGCRPGPRRGAGPLSGRAKPLDGRRLRQELAVPDLVERIVVLDEVDSTNDEVRRRARAGAASGLVVIADRQSAGRGRRGRDWYSAPGLGLYLSVLLRPEAPPRGVTRWTLGAAVAACLACRETADAAVTIEWPNDLQVGPQKVGGVLTELRSSSGRTRELVVGLGINVGHQPADWPEELRGRATSLRACSRCGIVVQREALAVAFLRRLRSVLGALEGDRWDEVRSQWEALAPHARGFRVRVVTGKAAAGGGVFEGVTAGLDARGALQVRTADGRLHRVRDVESVTLQED